MPALNRYLRVLRRTVMYRYIDRAWRRTLASFKRQSSRVGGRLQQTSTVVTCEHEPDPHIHETTDQGQTKFPKCGACLTEFEHNSTSLVEPCRECKQLYCDRCLRTMFTAAISDVTRMPPRCCRLLQLHTAIDFLADDEISSYRSKFEEWMTHDKTYCPKPTCSAFMSPLEITAMLAQSDAARATVDCPKCSTSICTACKNVGHEGPCDTKGKEEELAMLTRYGYKQCPNCHRAITKMFGCDHMGCLCGGHFCWSCLQPLDVCGGCGDSDDDDADEEADEQEVAEERGGENDTGEESRADRPDSVEGDDAQEVQASAGEANVERTLVVSIPCETRSGAIRAMNEARRDLAGDYATPPLDATKSVTCTSTANEISVPAAQPMLADQAALASELSDSAASITPKLDDQHINLDGGGWGRWDHEDINFGDDPSEHPYIMKWGCHHPFEIFEYRRGDYSKGNLARMECNHCFRNIVPHSPSGAVHDKLSAGGPECQNPSASQSGVASTKVARGEEHRAQVEQRAREQAWECGECRIMMCVDCKKISQGGSKHESS
nr:isoform 2 of probable e3 ubiquitin-protein ligase ari11 [Quercus suber]